MNNINFNSNSSEMTSGSNYPPVIPPGLSVHSISESLKRISDIVLSLAGILITAPFVLIYTLYAALLTRRSPFLIQSRTISTAHPVIKVPKLRTLRPIIHLYYGKTDAVSRESEIKAAYIPFGRTVRTHHFDKLPQLINVLKGEMSLIGPKAFSIEKLRRIQTIDAQQMQLRTIIKSKPGISGLWQVNRIIPFSIEELMFYDLLYEREKGFITDMKILLKTFGLILFRRNIDTSEDGK